MSVSHRGYSISKRHGKYVATDDPFEVCSAYMPRLLRAIDALWAATSQVTSTDVRVDELVAPRWLREWIVNPTESINLDATYASGAC